jgi:hypothetical protein
MVFCKRLLLIILLSPLCTLAAPPSDDAITWPELPKGTPADPLVLQLAISSTQLAYGRPFDFYVRFVNCGKEDLDIPLINDDIDEKELLKTSFGNGNQAYPDIGCHPNVVLKQNETFILRIPDQYARLCKFCNKVSYRYSGTRREIHSNIVTYVCQQKPFSEAEVAACHQHLEKLIDQLAREEYAGETYNGLEDNPIANQILMIATRSNPYCLPFVRKQLAEHPDAKVRHTMLSTLQFLAGKGDAEELGFVYDLSSADLLLDRLADEKDPKVQSLVVGILSVYAHSGGLSSEQKKRFLKGILPHVDSTNTELRITAVVILLDIFPEQYEVIEQRLNNKDFYLGGYEIGTRRQVKEAKAKKQKQQDREPVQGKTNLGIGVNL